MIEKARQGVACYASFIACLVAAAETGSEDYASQLGWIDEVRSPREWPNSGLTFWVDLPDLVFFTAQVLVGSMLMVSGAIEFAYRLGAARVSSRYESESLPLFEQNRLNGWPEALGHNCENAWNFLRSIIANWKWLSAGFGDAQEVQTGISAYYLLLGFLNFLSLAKRGELKDASDSFALSFAVSVPLNFIFSSSEASTRGYKLLLRQAAFLNELLQKNGIPQSQLESLWPKWVQETNRWLMSAFHGRLAYHQNPYKSLLSDLRSDLHEL